MHDMVNKYCCSFSVCTYQQLTKSLKSSLNWSAGSCGESPSITSCIWRKTVFHWE